MKYRNVLDEVQPHYVGAIIAAVAAIGASVASASASANQRKKAKRSAANSAQMAQQGGELPNAPTAGRFQKQLDQAAQPDIGSRLSQLGSAPSTPTRVPSATPVATGAPPAIGADASGIQEEQMRQEEERRRLLMMGGGIA